MQRLAPEDEALPSGQAARGERGGGRSSREKPVGRLVAARPAKPSACLAGAVVGETGSSAVITGNRTSCSGWWHCKRAEGSGGASWQRARAGAALFAARQQVPSVHAQGSGLAGAKVARPCAQKASMTRVLWIRGRMATSSRIY